MWYADSISTMLGSKVVHAPVMVALYMRRTSGASFGSYVSSYKPEKPLLGYTTSAKAYQVVTSILSAVDSSPQILSTPGLSYLPK